MRLAATMTTSQKELAEKLEDADLAKRRHAAPRPAMVATATMQKALCNNKNRRKLDLNKPQIATRHTRIRISRQSWIQHQSTAIRRRNPKAREDKSKNNTRKHSFLLSHKDFGEDDKCIAIQSQIPVMAESLPSPSTSSPPRMDPSTKKLRCLYGS